LNLRRKRAHVVGVGGVGMSALAQALQGAGYRVSGSDRYLDSGRPLPVLTRLAAAGIELVPQDGSGVGKDCDVVVVSTAIESGNPDTDAAMAAGVPVVHRAEMLARLAAGRRVLAVGGTAGKTTVTGMLGWIFESAGLDPTVVNGGAVLDWIAGDRVGNVRQGASDWWILEADESDRSFLQYSPEWSLVTNISKDHFELAESEDLFRLFAAKARAGIVAGADAAARIGSSAATCVVADFEPGDPVLSRGGSRFTLAGRGIFVPLPGRHNAENALMASTLALRAGVEPGAVAEAMGVFRGIERRLERVSGPDSPCAVFDDMAHNPAKIRAAWTAVRQEGAPVAGLWRPHGFAPLALMFDELVAAFGESMAPEEALFLLPVYYAGGTARGTRTSEDLARALAARGLRVECLPGEQEAEARLTECGRAGHTILIMGARDPGLPELARRCTRTLASGTGR
jgi:UDP-N-acetylmuramate--alanine ligase